MPLSTASGATPKLAYAALALLLLAAFALRLHGIAFGLPALNDSDELMFQLGAVKMLREQTLNPGWFGHPATTTMYVLAVVDAGTFVFGWLAGWFGSVKDFVDAIYADPTWVILPSRVAMALFGVGCVHLTYRLARELFDVRVGLAAAALLAVNPVHITYSQVIRSDVMATVFMLLCMSAALRIAREGRWRDVVKASLWLALAVATKWPFALSALAVFGAVALRMQADRAKWPVEARRIVWFGVLALGFLFLVSPFLLLDYETVLRNVQGEAQARHLSATGGGPLHNAWWYLSGPILDGLGLAGALLAAGGLVLLARKREALAIVGPVALAFFLLICAQNLVWQRWALPLMPLVSIMAGLALVTLAQLIQRRLVPRGKTAVIAAAMVALCTISPALHAVANARERLHDTRQLATAWIRAHAPPGSTIMVEHFAFDLVPDPFGLTFPGGNLGCVDGRALLQGKIKYSAIDSARGGQANVDYGTLPAGLRDTCRPDFAVLTQYDRYRVEKEQFPAEYAAYRDLIARGHVEAVFSPSRGESGELIVRVVSFPRNPPADRSPQAK